MISLSLCVCLSLWVLSSHRGGVAVTPNNDKSRDVCLIGFSRLYPLGHQALNPGQCYPAFHRFLRQCSASIKSQIHNNWTNKRTAHTRSRRLGITDKTTTCNLRRSAFLCSHCRSSFCSEENHIGQEKELKNRSIQFPTNKFQTAEPQ